SQIIPAATVYQQRLAQAITGAREALGKSADLSAQQELLKRITELVNKTYATHKDILAGIDKASSIHDEQKKAEMLCSKVKPKMNALRDYVDELEGLVDDELWPLPKFWEMLFIS
ncbi:MAG: glutamine synthetase type III, partial [Deltaproteobacteria bacterium]|nr:glutamine synthetase type III [Deltaproteobacteria bacterium]